MPMHVNLFELINVDVDAIMFHRRALSALFYVFIA